MKLVDISDYISPIACGATLFINHGLRDYLVTGLSSLNVTTIDDSDDINNPDVKSYINKSSNNSSFYNDQYLTGKSASEDWTGAELGAILGSVHFGIFLATILSPFTIPRISRKYFLAGTLVSSGILALFSELVVQEKFIGLAPWVGSAAGTLLGWCNDPFIGAYVFGSLSIVTGALSVLAPSNDADKSKMIRGKNVLTSPAVWACLFVCLTTVWSLHTFIAGVSFTLRFWFGEGDLLGFVSLVILVGGLVTRLEAIAAMYLLRNNFLSPLNRRRLIIWAGTIIVIISLVLNGTVGLNSKYALLGVSILGVGGGAGLLLVGIRLNLHDLGPIFPAPFLILGSLSGTLGAALATLLFPVLTQIKESDSKSVEKQWKIAWMVPVIPVVLACILHTFLLSVIPLSHQTVITKNVVPILKASSSSDKGEELDTRSFKSSKSAMSFRTAVSRPRTRTISFQTIDADDITNVDMQSFPESNSDDCVSFPSNGDENIEMKSIKSGGTSFKSAPDSRNNSFADATNHGVVLNPRELDRTKEWLSVHHYEMGKKLQTQISVEKVTTERNIFNSFAVVVAVVVFAASFIDFV
ncbi:hypothetical protein Anas_04440 [Armadillidium nasatum]|uniref:Sodium-dependent glucose transporter 1 n=1 Tax=Armadillidium nasatum TaxID=96803 RepID=A0A5N5SYT5_9CRUS|nr:hypothetical protein Anas_04440 [Armadillidium nasatum]